MKKIKFAVGLMLALVSVFSSAAVSFWARHWDGRDGAIGAHYRITGTGSAMILGDSLTEGFWWNSINGCRVVNAGYGGISAKLLAARVATPITYGAPRYVFVMVGTNSANVRISANEKSNFLSAYTSIVATVQGYGGTPIIVSIPPVDKNKATSAANISQGDINSFNYQLSNYATANGYAFVNLNDLFMDLNSASATYGYALANMTVDDGIHLTGAAYRLMFYAYQSALQSEIARTGRPCI